MPPAARLTDMHVCPMVTPGLPPIPHVGGPIISPGEPTVLIGFMPAARQTDMAICVGPPDMIAMGSPTVLIGGLMAARMGDTCEHGGTIVMGCPTVEIGESGSGGGGGGGGGAGALAVAIAVASAAGGAVASVYAHEGTMQRAAVQAASAYPDKAQAPAAAQDSSPVSVQAQAAAMTSASANGTPFCAICEKMRLAQQQSS